MNTLIDVFETCAPRGEAVAMELRAYRTFRFSYADLDRLVRAAARWMHGKGIGAGDRVVIWAPNSPWWVVAYFGVILRGGVVVPVDFASDNPRARWIAEEAGAKFAFASRYKVGIDLGVPTVMMEELEIELDAIQSLGGVPGKHASAAQRAAALRLGSAVRLPGGTMPAEPAEGLPGDEPLASRMQPSEEGGGEVKVSDVAVLIYTSGTTGEPKGVPLSHANLMANLTALRDHVEILFSDVFLSVLPLSHSFEMMAGCLMPLSVGAKIVYLKTIKPSAIFEALSSGSITVFAAVPRLLLLLKGSIEQKFDHLRLARLLRGLRRFSRHCTPRVREKLFWFIHKKIGSRFRYFVSGGAALDLEVARFWDDLGFTVLEGYGLTECAPVLTANQPGKVRLGTVGTPVPGVEVRLAADGEIEARGQNIFKGYEKNPKASAAVFTPDGWFKTGDVGLIEEDGYLTVKTRKKDMIVTGAGMNVYPEDVEAVLGQVKGVKECTVIGLDRGQGEVVHAVLALEQGFEAAAIIAAANRRLDSLQHIQDWTVWEGELPKTSTMKVKKNEVRERALKRVSTTVQGDKEGKGGMVKRAIGAVVRMDPESIRDEDRLVTDLHLSSLDRADLLSRLEQEFRLDVPEDIVGKDTTVGELITIIEERKRHRARHHMRAWAFTRLMQLARSLLFAMTVRPSMRFIGQPRVQGVGYVAALKGPYIVASNHVSYFDQPMTLSVLPWRLTGTIATAAREDFFFDPSFNLLKKLFGRLSFEACTFFVGAFLLPQGRQVSESLSFMGRLADEGIPLFIYPEGERSWDGKLLPFQPGLARMVQELRLPVVPVRIRGMEHIFPRGSGRIRRGHAVVTFGAPLRFDSFQSAEHILEGVRQSIAAL